MGSKHKNKRIAKMKKPQERDQEIIDLVEDKAQGQPTQSVGFFADMQEDNVHEINGEQVTWPNLPQFLKAGGQSVLVLGSKNTGKSSLCDWMLKEREGSCMVLDCDLGRNAELECCVSLRGCGVNRRIWVGELSPLNSINTYLQAVEYLEKCHRSQHFTKQLIVNTMGYTSGMGQLLIYELYQIIKPKHVLILHNQQQSSLPHIVESLTSNQYVQRLIISQEREKTSCKVHYYLNDKAKSKGDPSRFQDALGDGVSHLTSLLPRLYSPTYQSRSVSSIDIYEQTRSSCNSLERKQTDLYRKLTPEESVDLRIVILGRVIPDSSSLFEVEALGFGWNQKVYYQGQIAAEASGVVGEGVDFEKKFYHMSQKQMIETELRYGRLPYMLVLEKCLGNKGIRNNPAKMTN